MALIAYTKIGGAMPYIPTKITSRTRRHTKIALAIASTDRLLTENVGTRADEDYDQFLARAAVILDLLIAQSDEIPPEELDYWASREVEYQSLHR